MNSLHKPQRVKWLKNTGTGSIFSEQARGYKVDDPYPRVALGELEHGGFIVKWSYSFNRSSDQHQQRFETRREAEDKYNDLTNNSS